MRSNPLAIFQRFILFGLVEKGQGLGSGQIMLFMSSIVSVSESQSPLNGMQVLVVLVTPVLYRCLLAMSLKCFF